MRNLEKVEEIMNTKKILTKDEFDFCYGINESIKEDLSYFKSLKKKTSKYLIINIFFSNKEDSKEN